MKLIGRVRKKIAYRKRVMERRRLGRRKGIWYVYLAKQGDVYLTYLSENVWMLGVWLATKPQNVRRFKTETAAKHDFAKRR